MAKKNPCKRRILLKLSGEALSKDGSRGVDPKALNDIAKEIAHLHKSTGCQLAIVIGGGNIWRGLRDGGGVIDRVNSDSMGMLATVINAIALQSALEENGCPTRVQNLYQYLSIGRTFRPPQNFTPFRKRAHCHLCRWHREPVFYDGQRRRVACV